MTWLELLKDGGFKSRKLLIVLLGLFLVTTVAILAGKYPGIQVIFPTFCTTVTGLVAIYLGANGALKYVYAKNKPEELSKKDE